MVSKRLIEPRWKGSEVIATQRFTLYIAQQNETPARIEKYIVDGDEFIQHQDEYIDETGTGISMPIPAIHFRNEEIRPLT